MVSAGHVCCTRGSGMVSNAADMLWMSLVRGMTRVGGVCEICMCFARGGMGGEGVSGFGLYQSCGKGGVLDVSLCLSCGSVGGVGRVWVGGRGIGPGSGGVGWSYVSVRCESVFSV